MIKTSKHLLLLVSLVVLASCNKQDLEDRSVATDMHTPLVFSSELPQQADTRVSGADWQKDTIGIYMFNAGGALETNSVISANKKYITAGNGLFSAQSSSESIFIPKDGRQVDFISYYPYQSITNYTYPIDLSNQASQEKLDFLYSSSTKNISSGQPTIQLSFARQLTKIAIEITAEAGVNTAGLIATIQGMNTQAAFNLANGTLSDGNTPLPIPMHLTSVAGHITAQAIILPIASSLSSQQVTITLSSGSSYAWNIPVGTTFEKGKRYTYTLTLKRNPNLPATTSGYFENPVITEEQDRIFVQKYLPTAGRTTMRNYSMLYDTRYKLAYWIAYPLHATYLGSQKRTDKWGFDPDVNELFQPNLASSYKDPLYDRGHQLPSADRTANAAENATTFLYTNMTAQYFSFNQGEWANLETKIRNWVGLCDTLYVVTGAMIATSTDPTVTYTPDSKGTLIALPKYYYKALAQKIGNQYYTIAFKMDNKAHPAAPHTYNDHRLTVAELETETGFTFFPSLTAPQKETIDANKWN